MIVSTEGFGHSKAARYCNFLLNFGCGHLVQLVTESPLREIWGGFFVGPARTSHSVTGFPMCQPRIALFHA